MNFLKQLFWVFVSFFGYVRVTQLDYGQPHPLMIRVKWNKTFHWDVLSLPYDAEVIYHSTGLTLPRSSHTSVPKLAGTALLFVWDDRRYAISRTGRRWKALSMPKQVSRIVVISGDQGLLKFMDGRELVFQHEPIQNGLNVRTLLSYLSGQMTSEELLTLYAIGVHLTEMRTRNDSLLLALTEIRDHKRTCNSGGVGNAQNYIERAMIDLTN